HGQFDNQRLMNPASHRDLLDAFGGHGKAADACRKAWNAWQEAAAARVRAADELAAARRDEDYLRHAAKALADLSPRPGEEAELARDRALMMAGEKIIEAMNAAQAALNDGRGVEGALQAALRAVESVAGKAEGALDEAVAALGRAAAEAAEAQAQIERASAALEFDPGALEKAEERLFALRALARKHGVEVDGLAGLLVKLEGRLAALDTESGDLQKLEQAEAQARQAYVKAAGALRQAREAAAKRLDKAMAGELAPL